MPYSSIAVDSGCGQNPLVKQDPPQPPFKRGEPGKSPPVSPPVGGKQGGDQGGTPDLPNTGVTATSATTFDRTR